MTRTPRQQTAEIKATLVRMFGTRAGRRYSVKTVACTDGAGGLDLASTIASAVDGAVLSADTLGRMAEVLGGRGFRVRVAGGLLWATRPAEDEAR